MKIVAAISSPHQDDVIERILRHLNLWPSGLTLRVSLRARASKPTASRYPASPASSPLPHRSRLSRRGSESARRVDLRPGALVRTLPKEREEPSCAEPIDPERDVDEYAVDPPWQDDL